MTVEITVTKPTAVSSQPSKFYMSWYKTFIFLFYFLDPTPPGEECSSKEFKCRDGKQCIPRAFHCDNDMDCMDNSDEIGCSDPIIVQPPPSILVVDLGETIILTCRAIGVPTPEIIWRLNWGYVPDKCVMER